MSNVILRVFTLNDGSAWFGYIGLGAYHSCIIVHDLEYSFSNNGISTRMPSTEIEGATFYKDVELGEYHDGINQLHGIIARMRQEFTGNKYHIVHCNCNTFANALAKQLVQVSIPSWVNRAAKLGSMVLPNGKQQAVAENKPEVESKSKHVKPKLTAQQQRMLSKMKA